MASLDNSSCLEPLSRSNNSNTSLVKPPLRTILSSSSSSLSSPSSQAINTLSSSSSSTSLSILSPSRSQRETVIPPHIRYQTSPLSTMSSTEYHHQQQQNSNSQASLTQSSNNNSLTNLIKKKSNTPEDQSEPMDYLEYMEKGPCFPPTYSAANASKNIRYPVYESVETNILPEYSPSIHQIALVLRKVEWLSPYEPSPIRNWKNLVMELNSTQLNFYSIDNLPLLNRVKKSKTKKYYEFTPIENDYILNALKQNPDEYLTSKKLVKSYSLQFAKFGLPVDYKKKNNCLRVRAETEQFLLHFHSIDEMINWSSFLSTGINVSLDIETRRMPTDRTVPRRRRNRRGSSANRNRSYSDSEIIRRELTPIRNRRSSFSGESSIKSKISRIFNRRKSGSSDSTTDIAEIEALASKFQLQCSTGGASTIPTSNSTTSMSSTLNSAQMMADDNISRTTSEAAETVRNEIHTIREEEETDEQEPNSVQELHDDDDDSDEDDTMSHEEEEEEEDSVVTTSQNNLFHDFSFSHYDDEKQWLPEHKVITRRKFLKDSLRCIRLLPGDEEWVGRCLVRCSNPPRFKTANQIKTKNSKNKFVKEFIVGPQGLVSVLT